MESAVGRKPIVSQGLGAGTGTDASAIARSKEPAHLTPEVARGAASPHCAWSAWHLDSRHCVQTGHRGANSADAYPITALRYGSEASRRDSSPTLQPSPARSRSRRRRQLPPTGSVRANPAGADGRAGPLRLFGNPWRAVAYLSAASKSRRLAPGSPRLSARPPHEERCGRCGTWLPAPTVPGGSIRIGHERGESPPGEAGRECARSRLSRDALRTEIEKRDKFRQLDQCLCLALLV